jgi:putative DNA primase/helicase
LGSETVATRQQIDFAGVASAALARVDALLGHWLPGGRKRGAEYLARNPRRDDHRPGSFCVNHVTGRWSDFATGDAGGDLLALVAYLDDVPMGEAARRLADFLGQAAAPEAASAKKSATWRAIVPVPDDAPPPPDVHPRHGRPSSRWHYRDSDGRLMCLICRFDPARQRKQFAPLTFCENSSGRREWRWQALPAPRPLYGLDRLAAQPGATVVVCEGEKAADAAEALFPGCVAVSPPNGAQSPGKADWGPLAGRVVWLWPDNDDAGRACMSTVASLLKRAGAASVALLNVGLFARRGTDDFAPGALPEKFDAADAVVDGWTADEVDRLRARSDFLNPVPEASAPSDAQPEKTDQPLASHFFVDERGVWYLGRGPDGRDAPPLWICAPLRIGALVRDSRNESWGRLLEFHDPDGQSHTWAMPMELLKADGVEARAVLLSFGLEIATSRRARALLMQYLQTARPEARARCASRTGWHDAVFVLPDRTIGDSQERTLYQAATAAPNHFRQAGTLAEWQAEVAANCMGNSRLLFAVSAAFAPPLLEPAGIESGGFHVRGDSSSGKTTLLRVASSVWGSPGYLQTWRATENGLEAVASAHCDCSLLLDELAQIDPRVAGEAAYLLAAGIGKARAGRTGGLREASQWRTLFLSSGEVSLAEHMQLAGRRLKAGMAMRLLDIPADAGAGLGVFDQLHGEPSAASFSRALVEASAKFHGTAATAFIEAAVRHRGKLAALVKEAQRGFVARNLPADAAGQAYRAALRFALVGAAGELATAWKITGWQLGSAMRAAEAVFGAWLEQRGGAGNQEIAQIVAQVRAFLELHGDARFVDWDRAGDDHAPKTVSRAGFRRFRDALDETGHPVFNDDGSRSREAEFFVLPEVFRHEVCRGHDYKTVARILAERAALLKDGSSFTRRERLPGLGNMRVYRITPKLWEEA